MRRLLRRGRPVAAEGTGQAIGGGTVRTFDSRGLGARRDDTTDNATEKTTDKTTDKRTLRSRRRFARRQWRRRWLAWKYVIVLVLVILLLCLGIWAAYFSSWLEVKGVDVQGNGVYVSATDVRRFADVPIGDPLLTADLGAVRLRVEANLPAVKSVDVSREWPDRILIKVTERTPVAVVSIGGELRALDQDGTVFWHYDKAPAGLPRVSSVAGTTTDALSEAAQVAAALPPALAQRVDHVEVASVDAISLQLRDGRTIVWGGSADSDVKARVLLALMKTAPGAKRYDVSVPGNPVTSGVGH